LSGANLELRHFIHDELPGARGDAGIAGDQIRAGDLEIEFIDKRNRSFELERVNKCLAAGLTRIAVVSSKPEQLKAMAEAVHAGVPLADALKVSFYTPDEIIAELEKLAQAGRNPKRRTRQSDATKTSSLAPMPGEGSRAPLERH